MTQQLSPLKNSPSLGLLKSQSLCVLPGARGCWRSADLAVQGESLSRRFTSSNCSLREAVAASQHAGNTTSSQIHNGSSEDQLVHHVWSYFERERVSWKMKFMLQQWLQLHVICSLSISPQFSRLGLVFAGLQRSTWYVRTEQIKFNGSVNGTLCLMWIDFTIQSLHYMLAWPIAVGCCRTARLCWTLEMVSTLLGTYYFQTQKCFYSTGIPEYTVIISADFSVGYFIYPLKKTKNSLFQMPCHRCYLSCRLHGSSLGVRAGWDAPVCLHFCAQHLPHRVPLARLPPARGRGLRRRGVRRRARVPGHRQPGTAQSAWFPELHPQQRPVRGRRPAPPQEFLDAAASQTLLLLGGPERPWPGLPRPHALIFWHGYQSKTQKW